MKQKLTQRNGLSQGKFEEIRYYNTPKKNVVPSTRMGQWILKKSGIFKLLWRQTGLGKNLDSYSQCKPRMRYPEVLRFPSFRLEQLRRAC